MKKQEDVEKMLKQSFEPNKEKSGPFTPSWNSSKQEKSKTLRQVVFQCLKEGDFTTLDSLLLNRSTKDIEKFYEKEASKLLHLAITSCPPTSLDYLIAKIPQQISCEVLGENDFSFLRACIAVSSEKSEKDNMKTEMLEKLYILSKLQDTSLINFLQENSNFFSKSAYKSSFK